MVSKKHRNGRHMVKLRRVYPAILGISLGFAFSMLYIPTALETEECGYNIEIYSVSKETSRSKKNSELPSDEQENVVVGATVTPKLSKYGPTFRPYYVASELTIRESVMVGVLATESNLETLGTAINNTWLPNLPNVVLYVPFSKNSDFVQRFSKTLGLPVVQLADTAALSKTKITFKMLKHMQDNYKNKYNWFMRVEETTYLQANHLLALLEKMNSSMNIYAGLPGSYEQHDRVSGESNPLNHHCLGQAGVIISRTILDNIVEHLDSCSKKASSDKADMELGKCLYTHLQVQCTKNTEMVDYFKMVPTKLRKPKTSSVVKDWLKNLSTAKAFSFYPVMSDNLMYQIHQYFLEDELHKSLEEIKVIQNEVKELLPHLPDGVNEKRPSWPIGYPHPYVPKTRFGVIGWQYFTLTHIYGFQEDNPEVALEDELKDDVNEVYSLSVKLVKEELGKSYQVFRLINGYRKFDMIRGTDYLLDIGAKVSGNVEDEVRKRVQLLRPLTVLESVHMPHPVEQRGVYVVLPVTTDDHTKLERFLSMYESCCLQTGENVLLLTVFVNARDKVLVENNQFKQAKVVIERFKNKFKWAQVPWIQLKTGQYSDRLLLDVVSMKLPANALIFLARLDLDFTLNFLQRCRMNVINGEQVFFPIPFGKFDPDVVYRNKPRPETFAITKETGVWDTASYDVMCFENKDYKNIRMYEESFLQEDRAVHNEVLKAFQNNGFRVFRATEPELRREYEKKTCTDYTPHSEEYKKCMDYLKNRLGSRAQLSAILLEKEAGLH